MILTGGLTISLSVVLWLYESSHNGSVKQSVFDVVGIYSWLVITLGAYYVIAKFFQTICCGKLPKLRPRTVSASITSDGGIETTLVNPIIFLHYPNVKLVRAEWVCSYHDNTGYVGFCVWDGCHDLCGWLQHPVSAI